MATTARRATRYDPDSYMTLIRRFALKPLKNDADHARAVNIIGELTRIIHSPP